MNRKQYFATGWFFILLGFYVMFFKNLYINTLVFSYQSFEVFKHIIDAGILFIIMLSFPLALFFFILGSLEPKKK